MPRSINREISLLLLIGLITACSPGRTLQSYTPISTQPGKGTPALLPSATISPHLQIDPADLNGVSISLSHALTGIIRSKFEEKVAEFNTLNEWGITIYPEAMTTYQSLFETTNESMEKSEPPGIVITLPEQVRAWEAQGKTVELTSYMNNDQFGISPVTQLDYEPIFWELAGKEGSIHALPMLLSSRVLFYNQTWAKELGFSHPPLTSTEFRQQACAANQSFKQDFDLQNDGYGGWIINTDPTTILSWMVAFGGELMYDDQITFSNDRNQAAIEYLKKLYDDHCAFLSLEPTAYDSFARRSALFITADLLEVNLQQQAFSQAQNLDAWTIIPFPGDAPTLVAESLEFTIMDASKEKQLAAWLFMRWFLSDNNLLSWVESTATLPILSSAQMARSSYSQQNRQWAAAVLSMDDLVIQPRLASWRMGRQVLADGVEFIFRTDQPLKKISDILAEMDATYSQLSEAAP